MDDRNNEVRKLNQPKVIAIAATRQMELVPAWALTALAALALLSAFGI